MLMPSLMTRAARGFVSEPPSCYSASHLQPVGKPLLRVADQANVPELSGGTKVNVGHKTEIGQRVWVQTRVGLRIFKKERPRPREAMTVNYGPTSGCTLWRHGPAGHSLGWVQVGQVRPGLAKHRITI